MKKIIILICIIINSLIGFSQENDTINRTYKDIDDLNRQIEEEEMVYIKYIDSTFSYEVVIPNWLNLRETGSSSLIGGTLPAVKGIENAILVKGFDKSDFKSFKEFERIYLSGNTFGEKTLYSDEHFWYGQQSPVEIENGIKQKVYTYWNSKIYHNVFVLLETETAYLWVQFTSTPETFDINIDKFEEFMSGLIVNVKY